MGLQDKRRLGARSINHSRWTAPRRLIIATAQELRCTHHFNRKTLTIIGLHNMGYSAAEMVRLLALKEKQEAKLYCLLARLLDHPHPAAKKAMREGIPGRLSVSLPGGKSIRCRDCGVFVNYVPCPKCFMHKEDFVEDWIIPLLISHEYREKEDDLHPVLPECETGYRIGSPGKVEVMAIRHSLGEMLYHPDDCKQHYLEEDGTFG